MTPSQAAPRSRLPAASALRAAGLHLMHTTDNQGTTSSSWAARLGRDIRVAWRIVRMVVSYAVTGTLVRRRVRRCAARGDTYLVDRHHPRAR